MIRRFLDASTANLTPATCQRIEDGELGTAYHHPESCGFFLHVPAAEDISGLGLPLDLEAALRFAAHHEAEYVCFDRDAMPVAGLADHSDQWEATHA